MPSEQGAVCLTADNTGPHERGSDGCEHHDLSRVSTASTRRNDLVPNAGLSAATRLDGRARNRPRHERGEVTTEQHVTPIPVTTRKPSSSEIYSVYLRSSDGGVKMYAGGNQIAEMAYAVSGVW